MIAISTPCLVSVLISSCPQVLGFPTPPHYHFYRGPRVARSPHVQFYRGGRGLADPLMFVLIAVVAEWPEPRIITSTSMVAERPDPACSLLSR